MELSPQSVASTTFTTVKKGYDPGEVKAYLARLATSIEATQTQAAAMEARARAAVSRLQELAAQTGVQSAPAAVASPSAPTAAPVLGEPDTGTDEAHTISRTLLLAQRTADTAIAEANAEAKKIREDATAEARRTVDEAKHTQGRLVEEAKAEARRASEDQRVQIDSEVQSLLARREFLLSDVEHLEQHVIGHRNRLRDLAASLNTIVDSPTGGLADVRRPLMSAVTDNERSDGGESIDPTQAIPRVQPTYEVPVAPPGPPPTPAELAAEPSSSSSSSSSSSTGTGDGGPIHVDGSTRSGDELPVDITPPVGSPSLPEAPRTNNDLFTIGRNDQP